MEILLDISRTVARARYAQPSGIDRVERAYIDWALARNARFLCRLGRRLDVLAPPTVRRLVAWLDGNAAAPRLDLSGLLALRSPWSLRQAQALVRRGSSGSQTPHGPGIYLNVGHDNLGLAGLANLQAAGWRSVIMVHDTIPLDHPGYARRGTPKKFRAKLAGVSGANAVVCNSEHTAEQLRVHATEMEAPCHVVPLGITLPTVKAAPAGHPHFVCLGTIEPRKNHALLLDIWSRTYPDRGPILHIIGRRGWENDAVFQLLDTHPMIGRTVIEHQDLSDAEVQGLLSRACALLFPSFAEGFGLPLAEALAAGVPVISSDLPALRELAGDVPTWLAPSDMEGWSRIIADYVDAGSAVRNAQVARLKAWSPPTWTDHFAALEPVLENLMETNLVQSSQHR